MRVMVAYPPIESEKGSPMLTQNRQFQWFHEPSYLYPCVPASTATLLQARGHQVVWSDCIAERKDWGRFEQLVRDFSPELIIMETKSPVVRRHWQIVDRLRELVPGVRTVLMGDHITGNPEETMANSAVDYCFTGGDWDFLAENLVDHLEKGNPLATPSRAAKSWVNAVQLPPRTRSKPSTTRSWAPVAP